MTDWRNGLKQNKHMAGPIIAVGIIFLGLLTFLFLDFRENRRNRQLTLESAYTGENVILEYYTWDEEASYMEPIVNSFNARHSNIKVNLHMLVSDDYDNNIIQIYSEGKNVDIIGIRGFSQMARYQTAGMLSDISHEILNNNIDITAYGNMYNNITIDNKYYGMPNRSTCWVLVYNKSIFDEMGLPYPGQLTWEEYRKLAKQLTHTKDDGTIVWGGYFITWALNFAGIQNANYLHDDDQSSQRKALELLNQLMNIDKSHMSIQEIEEKDEYYLDIFEQGRIAMMPMGEWFVGLIMDDERHGKSTIDWDLAPMPIFEGMIPGTTWGQYQFTGISSTCSHKDAAFEFLKYIGGAEGAKIYAEYGMLSAYNSEESQIIYRNVAGDKNVNVFYDAFRIQEIPMYDKYEEINQLYTSLGREYLKGNRTLDETMNTFEKERRKLILKNK